MREIEIQVGDGALVTWKMQRMEMFLGLMEIFYSYNMMYVVVKQGNEYIKIH